MRTPPLAALGIALSLVVAAPLWAAPVTIGMITTLSTDAGYLGEDIRDGFMLLVEQGDNTLGGVPVTVLVEDDGRKPGNALQIARRLMDRHDVALMTGIVFSNVAMAVVPKVVREEVIYLSANAGPSALAGAGCHPNYFNVAWQNDNLHEAVGQYVDQQKLPSVYLLAPNYPAGRDAITGFKRYYKGEVLGEIYTQLGQTDYAAEIANLRAANPSAVYFFLPGGMGINFVKQYHQAGLGETTPLFGPAFSFDERLLQAVGEAALGVRNASQWSWDLDNAANRAFVAAFVERYGRRPTLYASQGYDTAQLIASALQKVAGDVSNRAALREAIATADFTSVRGSFRFGSNRHPVQTIYMREVVSDAEGGVTNKTIAVAFDEHIDAYAERCRQ